MVSVIWTDSVAYFPGLVLIDDVTSHPASHDMSRRSAPIGSYESEDVDARLSDMNDLKIDSEFLRGANRVSCSNEDRVSPVFFTETAEEGEFTLTPLFGKRQMKCRSVGNLLTIDVLAAEEIVAKANNVPSESGSYGLKSCYKQFKFAA